MSALHGGSLLVALIMVDSEGEMSVTENFQGVVITNHNILKIFSKFHCQLQLMHMSRPHHCCE